VKLASGLALGFAAGVLALGVFLYSTGKLQLPGQPTVTSPGETPVATTVATTVAKTVTTEPGALPQPAAPDTTMPSAPATALPPTPNPALSAAPPAMQSMPLNSKLTAKPDAPVASAPGGIGLPLANLKREAIQDTFSDTRGGGGKHEAADIIAPRGTPVLAVVEGNVVKLFNSKKGGITVYQYDNAQKYCYYYAHLGKYAEGLKEGMLLRKGDTLGYVGSTGDAQANNPHLHFAILELGPDKHWYEHTTAVNPYPLLIHALSLK
jgi:murein DD-endopeptidase MepM/ murein hydrolase activator NlpD